MRFRTVLMLGLLVPIGLFAILNWQVIIAPASLNFVAARVEAPIGLLLLAAIGVLCVFFLLMLAKSEIAMLLETRKVAKELEAARKTAAETESSRVESMRVAVLAGLAEINKKLDVMSIRPGGGTGPA